MIEKPSRAWLLPTDGTPTRLTEAQLGFAEYDGEWEPNIGDLYQLIDCSIVQLVQIPGLGDLWVDEEGLLKSMVFRNGAATLLVGDSFTTIVGTAVLVVYPGVEDDELRVMAAWVRTAREVFGV